jgi:hypothetical protein
MLRRESKDGDKITYVLFLAATHIYVLDISSAGRVHRSTIFLWEFADILFNYIFRMIVPLCADERTIGGISMVASSVLAAAA